MKKLNPAVEHWIQTVNKCVDKWWKVKINFSNWPVFDLPSSARRWTEDLARREMSASLQGLSSLPEFDQIVTTAAAKFVADANKILDEFDDFVRLAREDLLKLWGDKQAGGAAKSEKRKLQSRILELLARPVEPAPSQTDYEVWDRIDRRKKRLHNVHNVPT